MADSIRDALTKAVAEATTSTPELDTKPAVAETPEQPQTLGGDAATAATESTAKDEASVTTGAAQTSDGTETPDKPAAAASSPAPGTAANPPSSQQQGTAPSTEQPPTSWSTEERKHWAAIPPEAQAAIRRRETEMRRAISASQEATSHKRQFDQALDKFQPLLKEKGVTDIMGQVIGPLMTMRAGLEIGTPEQKAGLVATIVRDFGIGIDVLDRVLADMATNGGLQPRPPTPAFNARQDPALAPLYAMAERLQAAQTAKAEAAIAEVTALPDFEDLRSTMADIMERATSQGKQITVLEAYDRSRAFYGMEPRIKPQISVSEAASALARSRNAASSVSGAPKTSPAKKPTDLRGQLEAAWSSAHS